jgi:hypothetical protein
MSQMPASNMNFLPEDYVERRQAARAAVIFIGLLVIVVVGIIGAYVYQQFDCRAVFTERDRVNAEYEDASKSITKAQEMDQEKARMVAKAELTTTLMERVHRSALLAELTTLQPKGVNMLSLELKSHEVQPPAGPPAAIDQAKAASGAPGDAPAVKPPQIEVTIDLTGTAPTDGHVAQYIAALNKSKLLTDVNLLFSEEYKRTRAGAAAAPGDTNADMLRKFHVEMKVNPDADLRRIGSQTSEPVALR